MTSSLRKVENPTPLLPVRVSDEESFTVRGVGLNDIMAIYYRHTGGISLAFEKLASQYRSSGQLGSEEVSGIIAGTIQELPIVTAELIAIASGSNVDEDAEFAADVALALNLGLGAQFAALEAIGKLTFTSEMPPKKFLALIAQRLNVQAMAGEQSTASGA